MAHKARVSQRAACFLEVVVDDANDGDDDGDVVQVYALQQNGGGCGDDDLSDYLK